MALRLIAFSFFALAAWIGLDAVRSLSGDGEAQPSPVGISLAAASLLVMPALVWARRRTGRELSSATDMADNATLGWSWADPIAALVIAGVAVREGIEAWRGDDACRD